MPCIGVNDDGTVAVHLLRVDKGKHCTTRHGMSLGLLLSAWRVQQYWIKLNCMDV